MRQGQSSRLACLALSYFGSADNAVNRHKGGVIRLMFSWQQPLYPRSFSTQKTCSGEKPWQIHPKPASAPVKMINGGPTIQVCGPWYGPKSSELFQQWILATLKRLEPPTMRLCRLSIEWLAAESLKKIKPRDTKAALMEELKPWVPSPLAVNARSIKLVLLQRRRSGFESEPCLTNRQGPN